MTSSRMRPMGVQDRPGTIPWNVIRQRSRSLLVSPSLTMVSLYRMLIVLPPSISTQENLHENLGPATKVSTTSGYVPGFGMMLGWSFLLQEMEQSDHYIYWGIAGMVAL